MFKVFQGTRGYSPKIFAASVNGRIHALVVSVLITYIGTRRIRFASRAVIPGGPLGNPDCFRPLLAAHDQAIRKVALMSQIRNIQPPSSKRPIENAGYRWEDHLNYVVDLTPGEEGLLKAMSRSRRKNLSRADKAGPRLVQLGASDYERAYRVLERTYRRARVPLADPSLFQNAFQILLPLGHLWAVGAEWNGRLCAVRLVLKWNGYLFDWYAGSTEEGRSIHADEWLVWQVLLEGLRKGCHTFDFGGAGRPGENYGPGEFKRRFGGEQLNVGRFEKTYHPLTLRLASVTYGIWRKIS